MTNTMTLTHNPFADLMHLRWGVHSMQTAQATMQAQNVSGVGGLLKSFGVSASQLERLGVSPVNARAVLGAESWRGTVNVSRQLSQTLTSSRPASMLLESVRSGWGSFETAMPNLARSAKGAAQACKGAAGGLFGACKSALGAAKSGGFFGSIFKAASGLLGSVGRIAGPVLGPLAKIAAPVMNALKGVGNFMRMIPGLNLVFAAVDTFKAVGTLLDPNKSWGEKLSALGKAALSIGAALPIPGASLLGGARGAWAVGEAAVSLTKS